jgi:DNA-binding NarL/FixJ family response regulator
VDDDADMAFLAGEMIRLANDGLVLAGIAYSGDEAMDKLADTDVVVLDFRMPGRNGLEVASDILAVRPAQKIVLFSAYLDNATLHEAERLGICECVSKDAVSDLPDVVRRHCVAA